MSTEPSPPYDIRMRGFTSRSPVETALTWIDQHAKTLEIETIDLHTAYGRVLVRELFAPMDIPTLDRSAVDGYALRGAETAGAGSYNPLPFVLQGEALPERPFQGLIRSGAAVRIMAGSPIPEGADAVLPADYTEEIADQVAVTTTVTRKIVSEIGYVDYCRVRVVDGQIEPIASGGVSTLSSTTRADGFVIVAAWSEGYPSGSVVTVHLRIWASPPIPWARAREPSPPSAMPTDS